MKKQDVLNVAIKIFGLYLLVIAIQTIPSIGTALKSLIQMEEVQDVWFFAVTIISSLLIGAIALYFILSTPNIAKWVSDEETEESNDYTQSRNGINKEELQEVVFSGLGLFFVVNSIPRTIIATFMCLQGGTNSSILGMIVQLASGIYLLFCSKQLVGLLKKLQDKK